MSTYDNLLQEFSTERKWEDKNEAILLEPYTHLFRSAGKNFRSRMISAFNVWLKVPPEKLEIITRIVAMLHTASLLVDDVEDNATLRRGVPVAHIIYGVPQTINSANYVYFAALQELKLLNDQAVYAVYTEELINLHRGQGMDMFWRDSLICPTEEQYYEMVNNKTGGLFRLAVRLMLLSSSEKVDLLPLVNVVGIVFQIHDDYMNLQSDMYADNKGYCEDLTEGKFSFPIIHAVRHDEQNRQILQILKQKTKDFDVKAYAVAYMRDTTHSFEYTKQAIASLVLQARKEIARLGGNDELEKILDF